MGHQRRAPIEEKLEGFPITALATSYEDSAKVILEVNLYKESVKTQNRVTLGFRPNWQQLGQSPKFNHFFGKQHVSLHSDYF